MRFDNSADRSITTILSDKQATNRSTNTPLRSNAIPSNTTRMKQPREDVHSRLPTAAARRDYTILVKMDSTHSRKAPPSDNTRPIVASRDYPGISCRLPGRPRETWRKWQLSSDPFRPRKWLPRDSDRVERLFDRKSDTPKDAKCPTNRTWLPFS